MVAVPSIPASAIVSVVPNVIDAGGIGLDLVGLILTNSTRTPIGSVMDFPTLAAVTAYFGAGSTEAVLAAVYFAGYNNSPIKPASLLFAQYPTAAVGAYLRGGNISGFTLAQLQALNGILNFSVDARVINTSTINLASATSFSNAASIIQTGINDSAAQFTGVIAVTTGILTTTSVTGTIVAGQNLTGSAVPAGTTITSQISGTTGGAGTYQTNIITAVSSTAMKSGVTTVTYDTVLGAFVIASGTPNGGTITFPSIAGQGAWVTSLKLSQAAGAVISAGAPVGVPATNMAAVIAQTQDFVSFMTTFEPTTADCVAFAAWTSAQRNRFLYVMWDTDATPTTNADTSSAGYQIRTLGYSGTAPIYAPTNLALVAAFLAGYGASIDYNRVEGRTVAKFRSGTGLVADVSDATIYANLTANGYNCYARFATANDQFVFFADGLVTGDFQWIDSYLNQIWMSNGFQLALMDLVTSFGSIPYNNDGYALIETAMSDQVNAALSFGAIRKGIPLSNEQAAEVNNAAGVVVSDVIEQRGWYVQVQNASAATRAARASPPIYLWYADGQSIQKITLTSVMIT